jgi:23S rRNA pseudouridine1911/1915/1917 synthase
MRLDLALIGRHPELSRRRARDVVEKGQVTVDGVLAREAGRDVDGGATILWDPHKKALPRARCSLPILHEDAHVLVVDKPAGLLTVPSAPGARDEDTALARVRDYAGRLRPRGSYAERVHRLDRDTSGALAFALSREARAGLVRIFRAHRIERRYLAIVDGEPRAEGGTVDAPLRESWVSGRRGVAHEGEKGWPARTHWHVRERLGGAALLEIELDTGRQHQIRVHLAHVGLPILGDPVYGRPRSGRPLAPRLLLHARALAFDHPVTGARVAVESPLPEDFSHALALLRLARHPSVRRRASPGRGRPARTVETAVDGGRRDTGQARPTPVRRARKGPA